MNPPAKKRPRWEENEEDTSAESAVPVDPLDFSQPWHRLLFTQSEPYRALRAELAAGWACAALTKRFAETKNVLTETKVDGAAQRIAMARKVDGYCQHAATQLHKAAPEFFVAHKEREFSFLDIGAAPGGLSKYLHHHLSWSGVATSLAVEGGGMPMAYAPAATSSGPVVGTDGVVRRGRGTMTFRASRAPTANATTSGPSERQASSYCPAPPQQQRASPAAALPVVIGCPKPRAPTFVFLPGDFLLDFDAFQKQLFEPSVQNEAGSPPPLCPVHSRDFCMAGAVQDQSQRKDVVGDDGEDNAENNKLSPESTAVYRERFDFFRRQALVAIKALRDDGSMMFVFGPSDSVLLMMVVHLLMPFVDRKVGGCIKVIPTMHVEKTPVYVFVHHLRQTAVAAGSQLRPLVELFSSLDHFPIEEWLTCPDERNKQLTVDALSSFAYVRGGLEDAWEARCEKLYDVRQRAEQNYAI